jgi:hypothetical protein
MWAGMTSTDDQAAGGKMLHETTGPALKWPATMRPASKVSANAEPNYSAASVSAFRDRIRASAVSTCLLNTYSAGR